MGSVGTGGRRWNWPLVGSWEQVEELGVLPGVRVIGEEWDGARY